MIIANLLVGISDGWWRSKHNRHQANPNKVGSDPDIELGAIAMTPEQATQPRSLLMKWLVSQQGWYFFPILMLEGPSLRCLWSPPTGSRGRAIYPDDAMAVLPAVVIGYLNSGLDSRVRNRFLGTAGCGRAAPAMHCGLVAVEPASVPSGSLSSDRQGALRGLVALSRDLSAEALDLVDHFPGSFDFPASFDRILSESEDDYGDESRF